MPRPRHPDDRTDQEWAEDQLAAMGLLDLSWRCEPCKHGQHDECRIARDNGDETHTICKCRCGLRGGDDA